MSRRRRAKPRVIDPDIKFNNELVSKFINCLMMKGKKLLSMKIFYGALTEAYDSLDPVMRSELGGELEFFLKIISNVRPEIAVKSKRVGGATYQVPVPLDPVRANRLAIAFLIGAARERSEGAAKDALKMEFVAAAREEGVAVKKRNEMLKIAKVNKVFAYLA